MTVRTPIGAAINASWIDPGSGKPLNKNLTARDDNNLIANKTKLYACIDSSTATTNQQDINPGADPSKQILVKWLPGHVVQLKILALDDGDYNDPTHDEKDSPLYKYFAKTMQDLIGKRPKGIVVDLRGNTGGDGRLGLDFAGFFTATPPAEFEVRLTGYNTDTQSYEPFAGLGPYHIGSPAPCQYYGGPTVVLTDVGTVSAGEWAALSFQRIGKSIVSQYLTTQGAFSGPFGAPYIVMAKSFVVIFSSSRGYDRTGWLLVESNGKLEGGVSTDILIPFNTTSAADLNVMSRDSALNFAVSTLR